MMTLKSGLGVTHATNLCTIGTSLESTVPGTVFLPVIGLVWVYLHSLHMASSGKRYLA